MTLCDIFKLNLDNVIDIFIYKETSQYRPHVNTTLVIPFDPQNSTSYKMVCNYCRLSRHLKLIYPIRGCHFCQKLRLKHYERDWPYKAKQVQGPQDSRPLYCC